MLGAVEAAAVEGGKNLPEDEEKIPPEENIKGGGGGTHINLEDKEQVRSFSPPPSIPHQLCCMFSFFGLICSLVQLTL